MPDRKKQIIIGGCPRSGTSLFADFLVQCGLKTVSDQRSSEQYPRGYHEFFPLLVFHKAMERYPRGALHRITAEPFLSSGLLEDEFTNQIYQTAFEPFRSEQVDFIKYPQLALSVDFLFEQYLDIQFVFLWRNPAAVFRSLVQKEFPKEMIPASGVKAILLQSVYAYHILNAYRSYPDRVTIYAIDDLINKEVNLGPELRKLGYIVDGVLPITKSMDPKIWTSRVPVLWQLYYFTMRFFVLIISPLFSHQKRKFSRLGSFNKEVLKGSYGSHNTDN